MTEIYLDKIKQEVTNAFVDGSYPLDEEDAIVSRTIYKTIDHLAQRGMILQEGWVAVPREPTEEMYYAGSKWYRGCGAISPHIPSGCYRAMIAAAPKMEGME